MKKLHIVLACSLLAVGCQKNLHAFWRSKPVEAPEKKFDAAKENKNAKKNNAQIEAERNRIAEQNEKAENHIQETNAQRANEVNTASQTAQDVFGKNKSQGKATSNMAEGVAKNVAVKDLTTNVINEITDSENLPKEKLNEIKTEAIKNSKTWSETWNESSFKQWIDTIVESVTQFVNKMSKPFTSSSGFTFSEDGATIEQPNLAQQSPKGKKTQQPINLSEQSPPINPATSDLYRNIEKTADVAATSDQLASDSKAYADTAAKTKTDLAAKNTWLGALGL